MSFHRDADRVRLVFVLFALVLACGCDSRPVFPVGMGDRARVAIDAHYPVYVMGTWSIDGFKESLGLELAKYNVEIVDRRDAPDLVVFVDIGHWQYLEVIDVDVIRRDERIRAGRVRVPDLAQTTLFAAAQPVAAIIAQEAARRNVRGASPADPRDR
jgi:hypothetical protein